MKKMLCAALAAVLILGGLAGFAEQESLWTNWLIIGLDAEPRDLGVESDWNYLADMLMILSVDVTNNRVKVTALDCDIPVPIEGHGTQAIGAAYYFGGPELMVQTVNQAYGLAIERYMVTDPRRMAEIIDTLGGVEIDLTKAERDATNKYLKAVFGAEPISDYGDRVLLTGPQAVSFGGSWDVNPARETRLEREYEVILSCLKTIVNGELGKCYDTVKMFLYYGDTNLKYDDITRLAMCMISVNFSEIEYMRVSLTEDRDPEIDRTLVDEFIHLDSPYPVVYKGSADAETIKALQEKLNENGAGLAVDGVFGKKTRAALIAYQEASGLVASGVCGYATWNALIGD